ncbi:solute carrier family 25 (peroxisomal adenine nucleotide transporter) [Acrasis kona]|uniref:Solute carrier family 25 (Peroxisomal adenine nucleotide transporter) n=1 Tax=Acrasis kona TaxID=1008807 RepID=A0AAW2Z271_9EUKA
MDFSQLLSRDALVHAIAGTCGGAITMSSFYPLEIVKTYVQLDPKYKNKDSIQCAKDLINEEGVEVLYKGLGNTLISLGCSNFVYFYTNEALKIIASKLRRKYGRTGLLSNDTVVNLSIASFAGVVNVMTTNPLWLVNTRMKVQHKKSINDNLNEKQEHYINGVVDGITHIAKKEGILKLWSGCTASLWLVSNPTILFVLYDLMKKILIKWRGTSNLTGLEFFLLGALSKSVATIVTYPMQLAQYSMRTTAPKEEQNKTNKKQQDRSNLLSCLIYIVKNDGVLGLFRGLDVKLVQTVLMSAFHFLFYEKIMQVIFALLGAQKKK